MSETMTAATIIETHPEVEPRWTAAAGRANAPVTRTAAPRHEASRPVRKARTPSRMTATGALPRTTAPAMAMTSRPCCSFGVRAARMAATPSA